MPPHSIGSSTISFGLVSIPIRMYTATSSGGVSFNLLHKKCGSRIKQQQFCPVCQEVVPREALIRGYEFRKDEYVTFSDEEIKALEGEASKVIDIAEFVPLDQVDPIYFEKTYYVGPDKGGEKAYRLLADALLRTNRVALASFVSRGKESLVLIRAAQGGLLLHSMYFADEVRDFAEIDRGQDAKIKEGELDLAVRLIEDLSHEEFRPDQYRDEYRSRVVERATLKAEGREVVAVTSDAPRPQVIDLMEALKESLARRESPERKPPVKAPRPVAVESRAGGKAAAPKPERKTQGGRRQASG
jgi:DNA end-binding protein Ku